MLLRNAQLKSGLFTFFFQELHLGFTGHMKLIHKMNPYYFDSYSKEFSLFSINGAIDCNISRTLVNIKQSFVISWWKAKKKTGESKRGKLIMKQKFIEWCVS